MNWLISANDLAARLANVALMGPIVVIDCRFSLGDPGLGRRQYRAGHVPGAYYLDLDRDLSGPIQASGLGGRHPLPNAGQLAATLTTIGVSSPHQPTEVVIYDDSRFAFAARLWWLLRYLGQDRVRILDGGWSAWVAAGHPVSEVEPGPRSGNFVASVRSDWVVGFDQLKGTLLVDAREADRFRGEREPIDPVAGHIPGAVNLPWQGVTDDDGFALGAEAQADRLAQLGLEQVGIEGNLVSYCGSGVTACVNLLAMELAGMPVTKCCGSSIGRLYAGSWSDWLARGGAIETASTIGD
jgi:thiosulfate/3-mercaptopyruvate sulfurtransferase